MDHLHILVSCLLLRVRTARVTDPTYWSSQAMHFLIFRHFALNLQTILSDLSPQLWIVKRRRAFDKSCDEYHPLSSEICLHDTLSGILGGVLKSKKRFRKLTADQGL